MQQCLIFKHLIWIYTVSHCYPLCYRFLCSLTLTSKLIPYIRKKEIFKLITQFSRFFLGVGSPKLYAHCQRRGAGGCQKATTKMNAIIKSSGCYGRSIDTSSIHLISKYCFFCLAALCLWTICVRHIRLRQFHGIQNNHRMLSMTTKQLESVAYKYRIKARQKKSKRKRKRTAFWSPI